MILVTGANGQLGSALKKEYSEEQAVFASSYDLNITDLSQLKRFFSKNCITKIINCSAYTHVDKAEHEKEKCFLINMHGVSNLSEISQEKNIPLIHISTDYVFDGHNHIPYKEDDKVNPQSVYGESKVESEKIFMEKAFSGAIIRTSWLYSEFGNNFVKKILEYGREREELNIVSDQIGTPTYAVDLAKAISQILSQINNNEKEIYHFSNEGITSWYDFSVEIMNIKNIGCKVY
ncbi:MAG: dTDP-4-dehydrorhamnose reductase, partial [Legionellales bacterium]|nr:dTDP-4-dehydrorhamnose reductase [Legionellales bacterium]